MRNSAPPKVEDITQPLEIGSRIAKLLTATTEQLELIDAILLGKTLAPAAPLSGPQLLGISAAADYLGVSRPTFWRMRKERIIEAVELYPGCMRIRRVDLDALIAQLPYTKGAKATISE